MMLSPLRFDIDKLESVDPSPDLVRKLECLPTILWRSIMAR